MQIEIAHPTDVLGLMASTSTQIDVFSDGIIQAVKGGEVNPLNVLIQLKAMEKASDRILKEIKPELLNEAGKYPEKSFEFAGNEITKSEHGTKYDFSKCGDQMWNELTESCTELKIVIAQRETFLKAIKAPLEVFNGETGETNIIFPPTKTSQSGLTVKIK